MSSGSESLVCDAIGNVGRWQIKKAFSAGLCSIPLVFHIMAYPLMSIEKVRQVEPGGGKVAELRKILTLQDDFNLTGERSHLLSIRQIVFFFGMLIGCLATGPLSDKYGRKYTMLLLMMLWSASSLAHLFVADFSLFLVLQFALAFTGNSSWTVMWIWIMEILGGKWRTVVGLCAGFITWALGFVATAFVVYSLPNWRHAWLAMSAPTLLFIGYYFVIPESPMWLVMRGRTEEAREILSDAREENGMDRLERDDFRWNKMLEAHSQTSTADDDPNDNRNPFSILLTPTVRFRSFILFGAWFSCSLTYFGLSLNSSDIGDNPYVVFTFYGLIELPAIIMAVFTIVGAGRRIPLVVLLFGSGLACVGAGAVSGSSAWMAIALAVTGKFFITMCFQVLYVYTAELYATPVRNTGVAWCSVFGRIGGMVAPLIASLGDSVGNPMVTLALFGLATTLAALAATMLPETKGKRLPQTAKEGESFAAGDKMWNYICSKEHSNC